MRGELACGHRVSPHGRTRISSLGDDILNTGKVGPLDNLCVSDKVRIIRWNACGRPRASVDLPAGSETWTLLPI